MAFRRQSARESRRRRLRYGIRLLVATVIVASLTGAALVVAFGVVFVVSSLLAALASLVLLADLHPGSAAVLAGFVCLAVGIGVGCYHAARVAAAPDREFQPDVIAAAIRQRVGTTAVAVGIGGAVLLTAAGTVALEPADAAVVGGALLPSVLAVGAYCYRTIASELGGTPAVCRALPASIVRADDAELGGTPAGVDDAQPSGTPADGDDADEQLESYINDIRHRVDRLARTADMPTPEVAITATDRPLTLTAGYRRADSTIVVSRGLLEALDERELEAVLAHELAHVEYRDAAVRSAIAAPAAKVEDFAARYGIAASTFPLPHVLGGAFRWCLSLVCRHRECAADDRAVELTGDSAALASALETLDRERARRSVDDRDVNRTAAAFSIVPKPRNERRGFDRLHRHIARSIVAPHPPTETRIERLRFAGGAA